MTGAKFRWHVLSECADEDACPIHGRNAGALYPSEALDAGARALHESNHNGMPCPDYDCDGRPYPAEIGDAKTMLEAVAPLIAAAARENIRVARPAHTAALVAEAVRAERERCATQVEAYAKNYPESVFLEGGTSRDAISGTAMRHAYRNAARMIREDQP